MATTVNQAFSEFLTNHVNLDPDITSLARKSRDWLENQLLTFPERVADFPRLYPEMNIHFGSFARRTKIRELDDIDFLLAFSAQGSTYLENGGNAISLMVPETAADLRKCCDGNWLNSRKLINKLISSLSEVSQYNKAETHRNLEAATLELKSYPWNFDIVPAFFTRPESDGRNYYIIPNGAGEWKKTDPRRDRDFVSSTNQAHGGRMLDLIRLAKYWNRHAKIETLPSYLLECLIVRWYAGRATSSIYIDLTFTDFLDHLATAIYLNVPDPKEIQGDLNNLELLTQYAVSEKAKQAYAIACYAIDLELNQQKPQTSIAEWARIFGANFPSYG